MQITLAKVIEAMKVGGYTQGRYHLLADDDNGHIIDACAIGQAALNLGVDAMDLQRALDIGITSRKNSEAFNETVFKLNDEKKVEVSTIVEYLNKHVKAQHRTIDVRTKIYDYENWQGVKVNP